MGVPNSAVIVEEKPRVSENVPQVKKSSLDKPVERSSYQSVSQ